MTLHRGKIATHPKILEVRPLTREDLGLLEDKRKGLDGRPISGAVARFRDPHHRVARLFASGLRLFEVVDRCGYSYQRVHQLSTDPAFQELIAKYREKVDEAFVSNADEYYELATANMRKSERMIAERLEEADDEGAAPIPLKTLVDISADRMDRFGYGKRQTNLNVNADFASLLEKAIVRSGKSPTIIEATSLPGIALQSPQKSLSPPIAPSGESSLPPRLTERPSAPPAPSSRNTPQEATSVPLRRRA